MLGDANGGLKSTGYLWIMKLDSTAAKQFQTLVDFAEIRAGAKTAAKSDASFVLTLYNSAHDFNVVRLNLKGEIVAKRTIPGE